jgi:hypothetical protein
VEAGEAGLAGEELLHGGLSEVALFGDEPIQSTQQRIHIVQRRRDGALFGEGWEGDDKIPHVPDIEVLLREPSLVPQDLLFAEGRIDPYGEEI